MNSKTASKARIYLYDEENIIKKITYIYPYAAWRI